MRLSFCLAAFVLAAAVVPAVATDARIDTQVRWRAENDNRAFDGTAVSHQYLRTRLGLHLDSDSKDTQIFVQLQDSRLLGAAASGSLANDSNVGVHQAFFQVNEVFPHIAIKAGRFEINHGSQRLIGGVGWHNVGRSFDGAMILGSGPRGSMELFQAKRAESGGARPDVDTNLWGFYGHLNNIDADGFIYYDRDENVPEPYEHALVHSDPDSNGVRTTIRESFIGKSEDHNVDRFTIGVHTKRKMNNGRIDIDVTTAIQMGTLATRSVDPDTLSGVATRTASFGTTDIAAFMFAGEVGFKPVEGKGHRVAVGIDFSSGDDDSSDDEMKAFNNLYYTGHKFRGAMDQFLASKSEGLVDLYGKGAFMAPHAWKLQAHAHLFQTAEDFTFGKGETSSSLGIEIDVFATKKDIGRAQFDVGGSVFIPNEDWQGSDADNAYWAFMSWTVNLSSDLGK